MRKQHGNKVESGIIWSALVKKIDIDHNGVVDFTDGLQHIRIGKN